MENDEKVMKECAFFPAMGQHFLLFCLKMKVPAPSKPAVKAPPLILVLTPMVKSMWSGQSQTRPFPRFIYCILIITLEAKKYLSIMEIIYFTTFSVVIKFIFYFLLS